MKTHFASADRAFRRRRVGSICVLLGIQASLNFVEILHRSVATNETAHRAAGYAYWKFNTHTNGAMVISDFCAAFYLLAALRLGS